MKEIINNDDNNDDNSDSNVLVNEEERQRVIYEGNYRDCSKTLEFVFKNVNLTAID